MWVLDFNFNCVSLTIFDQHRLRRKYQFVLFVGSADVPLVLEVATGAADTISHTLVVDENVVLLTFLYPGLEIFASGFFIEFLSAPLTRLPISVVCVLEDTDVFLLLVLPVLLNCPPSMAFLSSFSFAIIFFRVDGFVAKTKNIAKG